MLDDLSESLPSSEDMFPHPTNGGLSESPVGSFNEDMLGSFSRVWLEAEGFPQKGLPSGVGKATAQRGPAKVMGSGPGPPLTFSQNQNQAAPSVPPCPIGQPLATWGC